MRGILALIALSLAGCSDGPAMVEAYGFARAFSLEPLRSPELRIWAQDFESGLVTGYVVRPGLVTVYSDHPGERAKRDMQTTRADELIMLIPQLRRIRAERCQPVMDGGGVVIEGRDNDGQFAFEVSNHAYCEGYNLHVLERALGVLQTVADPGYGEQELR